MKSTEGFHEVVTQSVRRMLRPAVRLCLPHSRYLGDLIELLKAVFVEVAEEELKRGGDQASASRLSAMTGVHRKDIARLQKSQPPARYAEHVIGKIMVQWQHDQRFTTTRGAPRELTVEGKDSEFARLVAVVNGLNLSAYAVLFEMERSGIVARRHGKVALRHSNYVPSDDLRAGLQMWSTDVEDLGDAVTENLRGQQGVPNLHLKTQFDNLSRRSLPTIRRWFLNEGSKFHERVRRFLAAHDLDLNPELRGQEGGGRALLGTFSYVPGSTHEAETGNEG